jgi:lipopolysaccharide transport system ATP-binding protein
MENTAIKIENVKKEYRLGAIGGGTLKGDLQSFWAKIRHKEDPNTIVGEEKDGLSKGDKFMALNGVSFEVKKGEALGIIGHNGAGKSTLLKLLCRVTAPSGGTISYDGRIASMLEVGTGFHPELTGRENVYLNGAILGMTKAEIDKKFDEIVEFSEVGQFIDTPIKRYSSGMKVKLAFAVASHLDSEIMIMDEVLAVGDVAFQNKCIERMKHVAEKEGRTVIYVSHNMATVKNLCDRCIVLSEGTKVFEGDTEQAIAIYLKNDALDNKTFFDTSALKRHPRCNQRHLLKSLEFLGVESSNFEYGKKVAFQIKWTSQNADEALKMKAIINGIDTTPVGVAFAGELAHDVGENSANFVLDTAYLVPSKYTVDIVLYNEDENGNVMYYDRCEAMRFEIKHSEDSTKLRHWFKNWGNAVIPCIE